MRMRATRLAVTLEVVVVFLVALAAVGVMHASRLGVWQRQFTPRPFLEYAVMIAVPVLLLAAARRDLAAHGLHVRDVRYHLDVGLTCAVPYAAAHALLLALRIAEPGGEALASAALAVAVLLAMAWLLRNKPTAASVATLAVVALAIPGAVAPAGLSLDRSLSAVVFYMLFLGPGEEILFRGYLQSRLNESYGRPFRFAGVSWGWGALLTALLFGAFHLLNLPSLFAGRFDPHGWSGFSSFFWGLVLGYVREKTGSVAAPALIHGLPQAIAYAFLGL